MQRIDPRVRFLFSCSHQAKQMILQCDVLLGFICTASSVGTALNISGATFMYSTQNAVKTVTEAPGVDPARTATLWRSTGESLGLHFDSWFVQKGSQSNENKWIRVICLDVEQYQYYSMWSKTILSFFSIFLRGK